jgi:trehalose 6-phosphate phosphatase
MKGSATGNERRGQEAESLAVLDVSALQPDTTAIFLDFDGTLVDFAEDAGSVVLPDEVRAMLATLSAATSGAVAVVSGRPISDLDRMLAPLAIAVAGVHGLERRSGAAGLVRADVDQTAMDIARARLSAFAECHAGTFLETKHGAVALHYRRRPALAGAALAAAEAAADAAGLALMHGKMVLELKDPKMTKAHAIAAFMGEAPFFGRRPLFAGDDVTDEDAFRCLGRWDGIAIKVGEGKTTAAFRARGINEFRAWLAGLARAFEPVSQGRGP